MSLTAIAWPGPAARASWRCSDPAQARPGHWPQAGLAATEEQLEAPGDDLTRMVVVERDGNPRRRLGLTSPWLGKLAEADLDALDLLAIRAAAALEQAPEAASPRAPCAERPSTRIGPERSLVVGLAESSLMLAWSLHRRMPAATLGLTSRRAQGLPGEQRFIEPHSHGPQHHLALPDEVFDRAVIIEDEITTGQTLLNLVRALAHRARRFEVVAIADLRPPATRRAMEATFAAEGLRARVVDLAARAPTHAPLWHAPLLRADRAERLPERAEPSTSPWPTLAADLPRRWLPAVTQARRRADLERLVALVRTRPFAALYAVGEAIDLPLSLLSALPSPARPSLRHVTRSPWRVDGRAVCARLDLGPDADGVPHYLYNHPPPPRAGQAALLVGDAVAGPVLARLAAHLRQHGLEPAVFETTDPP